MACEVRAGEAASFVLGDLSGRERAAFVAHLGQCRNCQAEVASLASTVDGLTSLVRPVEPSPGFVDGVVAALPTVAAKRPTRRRAPLSRRMLAVAASVALLSGVAGWWLARTERGGASIKPTVASLHTDRGVTVGEVVASDRPQPWMAVSVDLTSSHPATPASGNFTVALTYRDGQRVPLGSITLVDGRGTLGARTNVAVSHLAGVAVVGPRGDDLCAGFIGPHGPGDAYSGPPPGGPPPGSPVH